ncbi:MAG: MATE family efflux transporter [Bacteroidales bacterium]|nr:MATE family efflux transporter [Bacteroidales bacterium]
MKLFQDATNRDIIRLTIPNIVTNITVPLLGMADFALMGHLKDNSAVYVGAIALGTTIFNVIYMSLAFLRMGTSGFTAQAYGASNVKEMNLALKRSLLVAAILALALILLQYPIQWVAFQLLDGSGEVKELARQYFYIRIFAAPATLGLYSFYGWYLGMQNAKIPMIIAILVNVVNIGLNFFFVYALKMTSNGVALASVLAQYSGLIVAVGFLFYKYKSYIKPYGKKDFLHKEAFIRFFKVNSDIFIRTLLLILTLAFFTSQSAKINNQILAVNSLLFQFFFFFSYFADGFAYAGEALTGKAKGAGKPEFLKKTVAYLFKWGWFIGAVISLVYWVALPLFMKVMTSDTQLLSLAHRYSVWIIILPLTSFAAFIWDGVYIGVTASKAMRNTMIISSVLIFLPAYYLGFPYWGNDALWLAINLFMIARGISMWIVSRKAVYSFQ